MEMPKPTEAHRKLEKLAGRWTGEERLHPSPWDPAGGAAHGILENRLALEGFAVVHDYTQTRGGAVTFRGHGVFCWDSAQKCYTLHWFDSIGMSPEVFRGGFEGNVFKLTSKNAQGHGRLSYDFSEVGHCRFMMEMSQDGEKWQLFAEGDYVREA